MVTLPTDSEANAESMATITAKIAVANAEFIASTTILITNAISNGLFQVEPFVIPFLGIATITTYFQGFGYTVVFPASFGCNCNGNSGYPYEPCFIAGFPEVLPPGYVPWNCQCQDCGTPRVKISWTT
jgi:hypothetical protein